MVPTLDGLRANLQSHRRVLVDAAARLGMGVVAAGAVPLAVPAPQLHAVFSKLWAHSSSAQYDLAVSYSGHFVEVGPL